MTDAAELPEEVAGLPDEIPYEVKQHLVFHDQRRKLAEYMIEATPEPVTSSDVAERFGWNLVTANNRLHDLKDAGMPIETKSVGARARVWWYDPDDE